MGGAKRAERRRRQQALTTKPAASRPAGGSRGGGGARGSGGARGRDDAHGGGGARGGIGARGGGGARGRGGAHGAGSARGGIGAFGGRRRGVFVALAVIALLVAAVAAGVLWQRSRSGPGPAQATPVAAGYPVALTDGVVVVGNDSARVTVEVYEDFLCPACGQFEKRDGAAVEQALNAGTARFRYHIVNILDDRSNPPGYSTDAANAALCAADAGQFPGYHASLYGKQPQEGGRGYTDDQLVQLGRDLGISGAGFDSCVRTGAHDADVRAQEQAATSSAALQRSYPDGRRGFATPTVVVNGKLVDIGGSASWLTDAIAAG
jgi:protein-disulfide isomerase